MTDSKKDYRAIARGKIKRASELKRPHRILVYSRNKKGKTTFCASAGKDNVLIIDPETGSHETISKIDPQVWQVEKWEDLDDLYKFLRLNDHGFEWIAIDGLTRIANMALRWVMKRGEERPLDMQPGQIAPRDYGRAGEMVKGLLYNLHNLPVGIIYTAQERMQEPEEGSDTDPEIESEGASFVPDLPKGIRSTVNSLVDVIGRLYVVRATVKVRDPQTKAVKEREVLQRRLWLEPTVTLDTGYRSEYRLPAFLKNPTVPRLETLLREGTTK